MLPSLDPLPTTTCQRPSAVSKSIAENSDSIPQLFSENFGAASWRKPKCLMLKGVPAVETRQPHMPTRRLGIGRLVMNLPTMVFCNTGADY